MITKEQQQNSNQSRIKNGIDKVEKSSSYIVGVSVLSVLNTRNAMKKSLALGSVHSLLLSTRPTAVIRAEE